MIYIPNNMLLYIPAFMFHSVKGQDILLSKVQECLVNGGMFILVDLIPNVRRY